MCMIKNAPIKIAPSVLAADHAALGAAAAKLEACGADMVHFDVMDGHFVPNISFGPSVLAAIRKYTGLPIDAHLMMKCPGEWADAFIDAGADFITFHIEAELHSQRLLERIRNAGRKAGLVLNPQTPVKSVECVLDYCDIVLIMSVNPGFGGQKFLPYTLDKIRELSMMANKRGLGFDIEVDGGINGENARLCIESGATVLVAGSSVFSAENMEMAIAELRGDS